MTYNENILLKHDYISIDIQASQKRSISIINNILLSLKKKYLLATIITMLFGAIFFGLFKTVQKVN